MTFSWPFVLSLKPNPAQYNPNNRSPNTNHAEFTSYRITSTAPKTINTIAGMFTIAARANCHPTTASNATAAALTPSRNALGPSPLFVVSSIGSFLAFVPTAL